jgi:hypothetical protein
MAEVAGLDRGGPLDQQGGCSGVPPQREIRSDRGARHSGNGVQSGGQSIGEIGSGRESLILGPGQRNPRGHHARRLEARIYRETERQTAKHESGTREEDECQGHLSRDQRLLQPRAPQPSQTR